MHKYVQRHGSKSYQNEQAKCAKQTYGFKGGLVEFFLNAERLMWLGMVLALVF